MTPEFYKEQLIVIEQQADKAKKNLAKLYVTANNSYGVGNTVTDHIGTIRVERLQICIGSQNNLPEAVYWGIELNKDGKENKRKNKRYVYQSNLIENHETNN